MTVELFSEVHSWQLLCTYYTTLAVKGNIYICCIVWKDSGANLLTVKLSFHYSCEKFLTERFPVKFCCYLLKSTSLLTHHFKAYVNKKSNIEGVERANVWLKGPGCNAPEQRLTAWLVSDPRDGERYRTDSSNTMKIALRVELFENFNVYGWDSWTS